jgi:ATP-dependent DNA helicase RecG
LLFGERPRDAVPQAGLLARADLPDGSSTRQEFGEALVLIPGLLEEWLNTVLPSTIDRSRMERKEEVDLPFEMIREAVVNALVHRDYDLDGQKCQLVLNADTITVKSPGGPIHPITLDQLNSFSAPMKSRNPQPHYVFARMGMAEEQGFGLEKSLKRGAEELGLPLPRFTMDGDYLVLRMFRSSQSVVRVLEPTTREALNRDEQAAWQLLSVKETAVSADLIQQLGFDERKAQRVLKKLVDVGLIRRVGKGRATRYEVPR